MNQNNSPDEQRFSQLADACAEYAAGINASITIEDDLPLGDSRKRGIAIALPPLSTVYLFDHEHFPTAPPFVIINWGDGSAGEFLALCWPTTGSPIDKLRYALSQTIGPGPTFLPLFGLDAKRPVTADPVAAQTLGLNKILANFDPTPSAMESNSRVDHKLVEVLERAHILLIGLGSVGSYIAEQLVRTGLRSIALVDFDRVEIANLSRTVYDLSDVGVLKPDALSRHLLRVAPATQIDTVSSPFQSIGSARLRGLFEQADLVVAASDDPVAQALINSCAYATDTAAIFVGLYRGAKGGEVSVTVPGLTPCFRCQVGARTPILDDDVIGSVDYGTGRLSGEIALACDIHHVSSAALKIVFDFLSFTSSDGETDHNIVAGILQEGMHLLTLGMERNFWFYPKIFESVAGQLAFQSVWLSAESQLDCPVCGDAEAREADPFSRIVGAISTTSLRRQLGLPDA